MRTDARLNVGHLGEHDGGRQAGATVDPRAVDRDIRNIAFGAAKRVGEDNDHVVCVTGRVLPYRSARAAEERLQRVGDAVDAQTCSPRRLTVDGDVKLREIALVARLRLSDSRYSFHRFEYLARDEFQALRFRTLHVDRDGRAAATEDRRCLADVRAEPWKLSQLRTQRGLDLKLRALTLFARKEAHIDVAAVRPTTASADAQRREVDFGQCADGAIQLPGLAERIREVGAGRYAVTNRKLTAVEVRHPGEAEARNDEAGNRHRRDCDAYDDQTMPHRPAQAVGVVVGNMLEPAIETQRDFPDRTGVRPGFLAMLHRLGVVPDARQHGVERERHKERHEHSEAHGHAELIENLSNHAAHKRDGNEHRDHGQRGGEHRQSDFVGAFLRSAVVVFAHRHMAHDVFAHDDGVVDQQPDRERQRQQRHGVDGEAERPHGKERRDDRDREREPSDYGRAPGVQKQIDDHYREDRADTNGDLHVLERCANAARVVAGGTQHDVAGQLPLDVGEHGLHVVGDLHGVRSGNLQDVDGERHRVFVERGTAPFGDRVEHAAHVAHADRRAVAHGDDEIAKRHGIRHAAGDAHSAFGVALLDAACGYFAVLAVERGGHLLGAEAVRAQ